ncbi:MAG: DNA polymerase I [Gammaproteobacteria bacterium]|jgi:DNA polymerase-1
MQNSSPLILVDGSSYLYRAFHAMPNLTNSAREHTGAVYGVVNMLRKLIKDYEPKYMAVVFDAKGKTFRDDLYAEYKANRPPMPPELSGQIEPLHQLIKAMGIPILVVNGVEADDVIGTLARQATQQRMDTLISTGDKDMAQLVNDHVTLMDTMKNTFMNREGVIEKFGLPPERIIDYLALMGDKSDNIPGVPNVGPKTAAKWLDQYQSLDGVKQHADEIKGKAGDNLRAALDQLPLSYQLATIKCDLELEVQPADLQRQEPDKKQLTELFSRLEFKTWLSETLGKKDNGEQTTSDIGNQPQYETIFTQKQLATWLKKIKQAPLFAFDTETTDLNYMRAELVGISIAVTENQAAYLPLAHDYEGAPKQLARDKVLEQIKPILEDPDQHKVGQHLKYDMNVLAGYGIELQGIEHDTMLQSYVIDSTATRHDMDSLALKYLGCNTIHFEDVAGKGKNQLTFNEIAIDQAAPYAAEDADITLRLHHTLWPQLEKEPDLKWLYQHVEIPLVPVLSRIERNGVLLDIKMLNKQSQELEKSIADLESKAHEIAGEKFNIASPKQIQAVLFDRLSLPILKKTPKGQPSTAEDVLQELALDYPLPKLILEHRGLSKLKSTYTDKLPLQVSEKTGRVHTSYHQATASTGRLASKEPNLQNIPIRSEEGRRIRQAFIAPQGYKIVAADYSQIELRIMAHLSGDKGLLDAFAHGIDVHRATAAEVFGSTPESVSNEARRRAKAINFGLIYGMSAFGLARQLGISRTEAQQYVDLYFERYPGVKAFMDSTRENARETGYVQTVFGRRLYLPDINHSNAQRRQYAERTAINAPMQGTAADIIKLAMIKTDQWIRDSKLDIKMVMQVHDELVFEIKQAHVDKAIKHIENCMNSVADLKVPLQVDVGIGKNWDEAH